MKITALTTLLLCIAPSIACLGADPTSPAPESTGPAGSKPEAQPAVSFESMAQTTAQELKTNALFEGMDFEVFTAKPFVVLMTREAGDERAATDKRKRSIDALARGIWHNWLKVRADWQLRSNRKDTLEDPEPFVWTAFHSKEAYDQYMKKAKGDGKYTPGSQAFYSTATRHVSFYEDPARGPAIIIIHESFHQLMDRFSEVKSTKYQSYCFTEGAPEYFAGYRGSGEEMVLGELTRTRRMKEIQEIRSSFDDKKTLCYPQAERRLQITPDDWIFFDVPLLLTLRDKMWVRAISRAMVVQFGRSEYMERPFCKNFIAGGETQFHSAFYAYAWAFTYWLNKNHPEAYRRYAMAVLNTKEGGDAEIFLGAFAIRPLRPLPDIQILLGPDNRDVTINQGKIVTCLDERIAILRQTPAIQDMHRSWAEWMRTTFPKLAELPKAAPKSSPLAALSEDKNIAISQTIVKGDAPKMIYVPIIHDSEFSHLSSSDGGVPEIMNRCETIADHLYKQYGVRNILLEGLGKQFVDQYNRVPVERRRNPAENKDVLLVHNTWLRLLAEKDWLLLPAADQPIVGPLTALGREYDPRTVAILNEAKKSGWFRDLEVFTANQATLQASLEKLAAEYNAKQRALLEEDPGLKREYAITVTQRNQEFLDRILAPAAPGVVFFGAAHWQDMEEQLTKRGTSYAVVVPKGIAWPPKPKDAATIKADMLKLGAKLKKTALTLGDGQRINITIPIE